MTSSIVNHFLFKPPSRIEGQGYRIHSRIHYIENARGSQIATTYIRRRNANVTILFSHGNAEDLNTAYWWMRKMSQDLNVNIMGYDYTGYGSSADEVPGEHKCYCDIEAAYEYLLTVRGLNPQQIVLYGRSVGSGPSCHLAAKTSLAGDPVGGLILQSAFASVYRVVMDFGVTVPGDKFPNIDRMAEIQCPVCIIHGKKDTVVPFEHAKSLYNAIGDKCRACPYFAENMDHSYNGHDVEVTMMTRINAYLDYHILARRLWMKIPQRRPSRKAQNADQHIEAHGL